jgi:hypothetical protein
MCSSIEVWKPITGFEGLYEVSNHSRVRGVDRYVPMKKKFLKFQVGVINKGYLSKSGYWRVLLRKPNNQKKMMSVHRLVAIEFIPNPENKPCINHINGISSDNTLSNLEWCTYKENTIHAHKTGLCKSRKGIFRDGKKFVLALNNKFEIQHRFLGYAEAARFLNLKDSANIGIYRACLNQRKNAYGFKWIHEEDYLCNMI